MKKNSFKRIVCLLTAVFAVALSSSALFGCTFFDFGSAATVEFTRGNLTLEEGDTFELSNIINSNVENYTLQSSNTNVATVRGTVLTASGIGKCTVTVSVGRSKSTLGVSVYEKEPETVTVTADGELFQSVGATSEVKFAVEITGVETVLDVDWKLNGEHSEYLSPDREYSFTPTAAGEYTVSANPRMSNLTDSVTVRVYYDVNASGGYDGDTDQSVAPYSAVTLSTDISDNPQNPDDYVQWYVDGEVLYEGAPRDVSYTPTVGLHTVTLYVNGNPCEIAGSPYLTVSCAGTLSASEMNVVYDNVYPHAYFTSDLIGDVAVEVTMTDGTVRVFESNGEGSELFGVHGFDVGSVIDICATSSYRRTYKIRVKSLGDGGLIREGGYSDYFKFMQLPSAAKKYLEKQYADRDYYITSDYEFAKLLEYEIVSRDKTRKNPRVDFDCYIAYTLSGSADDLWNSAFEIAATSGRYNEIDVTLSGGVMSTSFYVDTVNSPSVQTYGVSPQSDYATPLRTIIPHINYDETKYRPESYVFPIDGLEKSQTVTYTDELYYVAENNARPVPILGSSAYTVYNMARAVLRKIVTDDMTDMEKAHAIYDWIMWQVTYDTPATEKSPNGERYSAYYLEGVFGDGKTSIDGVVYYPYAVCDGMSKAYSLMCNMEGIPCVRVVGTAGESMNDAGGHAWNKVFVDGKWYIADCTWGDAQSFITIDGRSELYEMGSHEWLFVTDRQADETHFEPYDSGDSDILYVSETTNEKYNIYEHMTYNGVAIDCRIKRYADQKERLKEIGAAFAAAYNTRTEIKVPCGMYDETYTLEYEAIEIGFDAGIAMSDGEVRAALDAGVHSVMRHAETKVFVYDDIVILMIKK